MLKYNPNHRKCAVRTNMKPATHQNQYKRYNIKDAARGKRGRPLEEEVKLYNFAKYFKYEKYRRGTNSRLCGNLTQLDMHLKSSETGNKHGNTCKVCGKVAYSKCSICGV